MLSKKMYPLGTLLVLILLFIWLFSSKPSQSNFNKHPSFPDGPDKAFLREFQMTKDLRYHRIPRERLTKAIRDIQNGKVEEIRNFNWKTYKSSVPGRSRLLLFHTPTGNVFSGSVSGGLWKNTNIQNNAVWEKVGTFPEISANCMAQDPNNPNRLFIGTGESFTAFINYRESTGIGNGIYYSEDAGASWTSIPSTIEFEFINDLVVRDENGTSVIYAAVGSGTYEGRTFIQEGLYRSDDMGVSWTQVLPETSTGELYQVSDIELTSDNTLYVGTMRNANNNFGGVILKSSDGINWTNYSDFYEQYKSSSFPGRSMVKASPQNPQHIYALFTRGFYNNLDQLRDYEVYMRQSVDGGVSWKEIPLPPGNFANIPWHALSMAVDPQNENKIVLGALNLYTLNDTSVDVIDPYNWIRLAYWAANYYANDPSLTQSERDYYTKIYVHADMHDIQYFNNNSDDLMITTDGGIFISSDISLSNSFNPETPTVGIPSFFALNNGLNTTQYYYASIIPDPDKLEFTGGTQDNGTIYTVLNGTTANETWISGGDGGFSFWDRDDPGLKITTVYGNRYYIHWNGDVHFIPWIDGLFVNPSVYDDQSNLIYSNAATSPYGGLYAGLRDRYFDTLRVVNVNKYIQKDDLGLDTTFYLPLHSGINEAITALVLSPYSDPENKTLFMGTETGKVYKVEGLPFSPEVTQIDNSQINQGYISSIDIGTSNSKLMVTLSNYGLSSVYSTRDGGGTWFDHELNLPDMPVRWGKFNPYDNTKLIIATEMGIWGLENTLDPTSQWQSYNLGFPKIRVDMIDIREEDSLILAATHGQGLYYGKINQGEKLILGTDKLIENKVRIYPNPFQSILHVETGFDFDVLQIHNLEGQLIRTSKFNKMVSLNLHFLPDGIYVLSGIDRNGQIKFSKRIIKR